MARLMKAQEVADILQVKPSTVYTWVRQGRVPHIRVGRLIRFVAEQIEEFLSRKGDAVSPGVDRSDDEDEEEYSCL